MNGYSIRLTKLPGTDKATLYLVRGDEKFPLCVISLEVSQTDPNEAFAIFNVPNGAKLKIFADRPTPVKL